MEVEWSLTTSASATCRHDKSLWWQTGKQYTGTDGEAIHNRTVGFHGLLYHCKASRRKNHISPPLPKQSTFPHLPTIGKYQLHVVRTQYNNFALSLIMSGQPNIHTPCPSNEKVFLKYSLWQSIWKWDCDYLTNTAQIVRHRFEK